MDMIPFICKVLNVERNKIDADRIQNIDKISSNYWIKEKCIRMKRGVPNAVLIKTRRRVIKEAQGNNGIEDELGTSRALLNFL